MDFFAGIGGFHSAFERVGWECVGFCEIDKFARQSYKAIHNVEGAKEWHDITAVTDEEFAELHGQVDVIAGGFPCQAFSVAGKRGGFEDSRGTLFFEVARAAKAIKPKYLVLENVKGLLSHDKGNTVDVILRTLNELGYTVDFEVLNTKFFGVPQNRERIFIVAVRDDLVAQEAWDIKGTGIVAKAKKRFSGAGGVKSFNFFGWASAYDVVGAKLRDVLETEVDAKYYLSNEKTAKLIDLVGGKVSNHDCIDSRQKSADKVRLYSGICPTINASETKDIKKIVEENTVVVANLNHWGMDIMNRVYGIDGQAPTPHTMQGGCREPKIAEPKDGIHVVGDLQLYQYKSLNEVYGIGGVSPALLAMQGGNQEPRILEPAVHATLTPDRAEKRQNGRRFKDNDEPMFTLTAQDKHGITTVQYSRKTGIGKEIDVSVCLSASDWRGMNRNQAQNTVLEATPKYRIRKLTPLECWRLQDFTDEQFAKARAAGVSDSQLYKQAGNSVTVKVVEVIAHNLTALDAQLR
nr:DNA (cytosine-5-)-methyltransferase [Exiguobacterium sp. s22]